MKPMKQHAMVIGASMGGLLAARALADFYEQVTMLECDTFPAPGEPRKGVPQGRHTHALLARGRGILEAFFPGLTQQRRQRSAPLARWLPHLVYRQAPRRRPSRPGRHPGLPKSDQPPGSSV